MPSIRQYQQLSRSLVACHCVCEEIGILDRNRFIVGGVEQEYGWGRISDSVLCRQQILQFGRRIAPNEVRARSIVRVFWIQSDYGISENAKVQVGGGVCDGGCRQMTTCRKAPDTKCRHDMLRSDVLDCVQGLVLGERIERRLCVVGGCIVQDPGVISTLVQPRGWLVTFLVHRCVRVAAAWQDEYTDAIWCARGIVC
jgi:hypothetical protein